MDVNIYIYLSFKKNLKWINLFLLGIEKWTENKNSLNVKDV